MREACPICGGATAFCGTKTGLYRKRAYSIRRCPTCGYGFVADPDTDYANLYDEAYYTGRGADTTSDYLFELSSPHLTTRRHELRGLVANVRAVAGPPKGKKWLDFGSGNGALVRAARAEGWDVVGFESGWIADRAKETGITVLDRGDLDALAGQFDIVTAIEVMEHTVDPLSELALIRSLLKPGGVLLLTTGNAAPFRDNLPGWYYVTPEVHIGFFEPNTLAEALRRTGFQPEWPALPGFADIIRSKLLKVMHVRSHAWWEALVPWKLVTWAIDRRFRFSAHPVGRAV